MGSGGRYGSRSRAIAVALREKVATANQRLAQEVAKVDPAEEREVAEEWLRGDIPP